jgi:hypothetical protein
MITYQERSQSKILVRLEGRAVGYILRQGREGWQYRPYGVRAYGATFPTLEACKQSLQAA